MTVRRAQPGPLAGLRVVEMAGMGPVPFCAMLLADMGAEVLTIDPPPRRTVAMPTPQHKDPLWRGRARMMCNLKDDDDRARLLDIVSKADVLLEGFRPGTMERLGLAPHECLSLRPSLVYGRMTGWGQDGPEAMRAGHDPNYLALTGALYAIGPADRPPVLPLNLVGDFGGGALYLAMGVLAAVLHARQTGVGQVVDASMLDGAASLMSSIYGLKSAGLWRNERAANLLDGGCPYVATYEAADGRYVVVAAVEAPFYANLLAGLELDPSKLPARNDASQWPVLRACLAARFKERDRDAWAAVFAQVDACVTPVLDLEEAPLHPHNQARQVFFTQDGVPMPSPAPRFSTTRTRAADQMGPPAADLLQGWGLGRSLATPGPADASAR
jgi:alpha-methylacyl-CoA racemase